MKKTILHVAKYYYPDVGGIETIAKSLAEGLSDYHNVVVCFATDGKDQTDVVNGITVRRVKVNFSMMHQDVAFGYFAALRQLVGQYHPQFVHVHCPNPYVYPFVLKAIGKDTQLVLHWHSDIISKGLVYHLIKPFEKAILKRADCILATSPNYIHPSSPIFEYKEKTKIVQNGIVTSDFDLQAGDDASIEAVRNSYGNKKLVFFVGRHISYKGLELLIEAEKYIASDCKIIIAGSGPLTEALKRRSTSERIVFTGRLSAEALRHYAYAAQVFAFPSVTKAEAFGMALAEAMYCGCVPVVFHLEGSGVNWVSVNNETGLEVPLGDCRAFAQAIDRLLTDEALHDKWAAAGRQRVASMFTDKMEIKVLNDVYHAIAQ